MRSTLLPAADYLMNSLQDEQPQRVGQPLRGRGGTNTALLGGLVQKNKKDKMAKISEGRVAQQEEGSAEEWNIRQRRMRKEGRWGEGAMDGCDQAGREVENKIGPK